MSPVRPLPPESAIEIDAITHRYGQRTLYRNLSLTITKGRVVALLGKNGVGKTTLIRLLMGFLRPSSGHCRVLGQDSHALSPATRARIGLLFEGHLTQDYMSIAQIERYHRPFYPGWRAELYYDLVDRMGLSRNHKIAQMSCGQRSQVVLGLIFAQNPELMILDDYSMGLDAGYRRLFLDYLAAYLGEGGKTVFLTSHVVQDMEVLVDEVVFLQRGGEILQMPLAEFRHSFRCFAFSLPASAQPPAADAIIHNPDVFARPPRLYSFAERDQVARHLAARCPEIALGEELPMTLEDAFIGLTGKY
ncbi:ATP-binding cassette domain-containing protein [Rhabdochromatium marinum]|uniref:ABC transporter ATP-binding protein n=1 Tax=Rhabdochromatium marinum TaxID=48729 RepID=UPI001F5BDE6A|nr:ABC transporter ATP-binding protein [Rhabdochromatium marinum]MBK1647191.1 methyltransferase [Rhabdochromatium marinum]